MYEENNGGYYNGISEWIQRERVARLDNDGMLHGVARCFLVALDEHGKKRQ